MAPARKDDERVPSVHDKLQCEAEARAADAAIGVLRRFRSERPDFLPKGLPRAVTEKLVFAVLDAWVIARAEQANRLGFSPTWAEAFIMGKSPESDRWLYDAPGLMTHEEKREA